MKKILQLFAILVIFCAGANAQFLYHNGPTGSGLFGQKVIVLSNGNYVITDPYYSNSTTSNIGAVYLYDGANNSLIGSMTGSTAMDKVGTDVVALTDGKFAVISQYWSNGSNANAGAVTICSGTSAPPAVVDATNSLVGRNANDYIGSGGIKILPSGNYVINSPNASTATISDCGASTWVSKTATNITGYISDVNSLVGSFTGDRVGLNITVLTNGNYVIATDQFNAAANASKPKAGAAIWCNQATGRTGTISSANALIGDAANDNVGYTVVALANGNYIVYSPFWKNATAGAVTWGNGSTGTAGIVSASNSLTGELDMGFGGLFRAADGNCIIVSVKNGAAGVNCSATCMNGADGTFLSTGTFGAISSANSLLPAKKNDFSTVEFQYVAPGKYVMAFPNFDNGSIGDVGAIRLFTTASDWNTQISSANSILGASTSDLLGSAGFALLSSGSYVLAGSPNYTNGAFASAGALTYINASSASISGTISSSNSIIGSSANEQIGRSSSFKKLTGNNFVLASEYWDNGAATDAGFVYFGDASVAPPTSFSASNALVGSLANDRVGNKIYTLSNSNYVVTSPMWDAGAIVNVGAVTWGSATTGISGAVSSTNSIIGSQANDQVGQRFFPLSNGNYVIGSYNFDNGTISNAGALTWLSGTAATSGIVSSSNSVVGTTSDSRVGYGSEYNSSFPVDDYKPFLQVSNDKYVAKDYFWSDEPSIMLGATGLYSTTGATTGTIQSGNAMVGNSQYQIHGYDYYYKDVAASNGLFLLFNENYSSPTKSNNGSVTLGDANGTLTGFVNKCNSFVGANTGHGPHFERVFNSTHNYFLVSNQFTKRVAVMRSPQSATLSTSTTSTTENVGGLSRIPIVTESCQLIASVQRDGTSTALTDYITAKVWVDNDQYADYVKRHFELTPSTNPATATAKVTLYCTQAEFNGFNAFNTLKLPANPTDATGIANLRIAKYSGSSNDGSGGVNTYPSGIPEFINPDDADIVWNASANSGNGQWEISFAVTGFSGFFITTKTAGTLPLQWLSLAGTIGAGNVAKLHWKVQEQNVLNYIIERSDNNVDYYTAGSTASRGDGSNNYAFTDVNAVNGNAYYRIKQIDRDGKYSYSNVVRLSVKAFFPITLYPSPAHDIITINAGSQFVNSEILVTNAAGATIKKWKATSSSFTKEVSELASGIYFLKFDDGSVVKFVKE